MFLVPTKTKKSSFQILYKSAVFLSLCFLMPASACRAQNTIGPKHVVIMIADGSGFNHQRAASLYHYGTPDGQLYHQFPVKLGLSTFSQGGEYNSQLAWSDFLYVTSSSMTDSAAAATAISTGEKTFNGAVGVGPDGSALRHLLERAEDSKKSTGVVTTVPLSHATPAGFSAHSASRENYEQIAQEMILNSRLDVIMSCGHPFYNNDGTRQQPFDDHKYIGGKSIWGSISNPAKKIGGDADGDGADDPWVLIEARQDFLALDNGPAPKRVFGIPRVGTTLQQSRSGNRELAPYAVAFNQNVPTLAEMSTAALHVLSADTDGFVLIIEGGAIDWAAHNHQINRLIEEQNDFDNAVYAVHQWIEQNSSWNEALLIVTSDHETGYLTGAGSGVIDGKPVWNELTNDGTGTVAAVQWNTAGHSNSLVPFFAKGAGSNLYLEHIQGEDPVRGPYIDNTAVSRILSWD